MRTAAIELIVAAIEVFVAAIEIFIGPYVDGDLDSGLTTGIAYLFVCPVFQQQSVKITFKGGTMGKIMQRSGSVLVWKVGICTFFQEHLGYVIILTVDGYY